MRGTEEATGKAAEHWDELYSRGAGVVTGGLGRAGVRVGVLGPTAHPGLPLKVFLGVGRCQRL
jgi:hypothetical protein